VTGLPTLKVQLDGPTGNGARVSLDGHDIGAGMRELDIHFQANELTTARMVIGVGALEIDAPTLAILRANVKVTDPVPEPEPDPAMRAFGQEPAHA